MEAKRVVLCGKHTGNSINSAKRRAHMKKTKEISALLIIFYCLLSAQRQEVEAMVHMIYSEYKGTL